jgi:hypothetical protein
VREIADEVRERLAQLEGVDLDQLRRGFRNDVELQVLAGRLVRQIDGVD